MNTFRSCLAALVAVLFAAQAHAAPTWKITVEQDGRAVFQESIRTQGNWSDLLSYALKPTKNAKDVPEAGKGDRIALKGKISVGIDGGGGANNTGNGQVELTDLTLQRAEFVPGQWIIDPADVARILELRKNSK